MGAVAPSIYSSHNASNNRKEERELSFSRYILFLYLKKNRNIFPVHKPSDSLLPGTVRQNEIMCLSLNQFPAKGKGIATSDLVPKKSHSLVLGKEPTYHEHLIIQNLIVVIIQNQI